MTLRKIGRVKEMEYNPMKSVEFDGNQILVAKVAGNVFAIGNKCTHMGCKLSGGKLDAETVRCPCHGSVFNVKTGEVVKGPAKNPVLTYPVKVENDEISIDI